jgi:hypothetical protein
MYAAFKARLVSHSLRLVWNRVVVMSAVCNLKSFLHGCACALCLRLGCQVLRALGRSASDLAVVKGVSCVFLQQGGGWGL